MQDAFYVSKERIIRALQGKSLAAFICCAWLIDDNHAKTAAGQLQWVYANIPKAFCQYHIHLPS